MSDPTLLFPTLPPDETALARGWEDTLALDETHRRFHAAPEAKTADKGRWRFVDEPSSIFDPIYESSSTSEYEFDGASGLVKKVVTTTRYGWPASLAEKPRVSTIELIEVRQLDTNDLEALATQARAYFAAVAEYEKTTERARTEHRRTAMLYISAAAGLQKATEGITLPWLRAMLDERSKQHMRDMHFAVQDAVQFSKLLDKQSADWQTTDLDGKSHALADYRGQVIVLDFWYRACGWCVRAMPQMKQLTDDFRGQPVSILGINSDRQDEDARYVIDKMQLNYQTLKNGEQPNAINSKYMIHGWPTLVVIDKKGVVRHIHYGYTPSLRSDIGGKIRELLAEAAD